MVSVKERILTIRLMDKVKDNPAVAEKLGILVIDETRNRSADGTTGNGR